MLFFFSNSYHFFKLFSPPILGYGFSPPSGFHVILVPSHFIYILPSLCILPDFMSSERKTFAGCLHPCHSSCRLDPHCYAGQSATLWCVKWFRVKVDTNKLLIQELDGKSLGLQTEAHSKNNSLRQTSVHRNCILFFSPPSVLAHNGLGAHDKNGTE